MNFAEKNVDLGFLTFNIFIILVGVKVAIAIHETGHLLMGKLMGGIPRRMLLGTGHPITSFKLAKVRITLNSVLSSGCVYSVFDDQDRTKLKEFVYFSGGILFNLIIGVLCFNRFSPLDGIALMPSFGLANFITAAVALYPKSFEYLGITIPSDGLKLWRLLTQKQEEYLGFELLSAALDCHELLEDKKYQEAISSYQILKSKINDKLFIYINLGYAHFKTGNFDKGIEILLEALPLLENEKNDHYYKALAYNHLSWGYLILNEPDKALQYGHAAYLLSSKTVAIRQTYGSALIENGDLNEGVELLKEDIQFEFVNGGSLMLSAFLALAYEKLGQAEKRQKHLDFLERNIDLLEMDERTIYDRIKRQIS